MQTPLLDRALVAEVVRGAGGHDPRRRFATVAKRVTASGLTDVGDHAPRSHFVSVAKRMSRHLACRVLEAMTLAHWFVVTSRAVCVVASGLLPRTGEHGRCFCCCGVAARATASGLSGVGGDDVRYK